MNEIKQIEDLTPQELDDLLSLQALQPRIPAACGGVVWYDDFPTWPELAIEVGGEWISNRGGDRRWEMIEEAALINYQISNEQIEDLWVQAGCEWHHVKRNGLTIRERFFRRSQVERFTKILVQ